MKHYPSVYSRIYFTVISVFALTLLTVNIFAQRAAVSASGKEKAVSKSVKEKEREEKQRRKFKPNRQLNDERIKGKSVIMPMEFYGLSKPLSEIESTDVSPDNGPIFENELERLGSGLFIDTKQKLAPDPIQRILTPALAATVGTSFTYTSSVSGAPPDTTMAVGPNHIVAWVNSQFSIFSKTGTIIKAATNGNAFFTGTGNLCATTNRGDPILQYDRFADRWFFSQFAFSGSGTAPPFLQCIAISQTNDPNGAYYRYSISFPSFNDYGKLGVWTDAYYTSYNMFAAGTGSYQGSEFCASDRTKMLAGDPTATTLCSPIGFYGTADGYLPADIDGTTLPTNVTQGGIFIGYSPAPALQMVKVKPNFTTSTLTVTDGVGGASGSVINIPLPATTLPCNNTGGTCVAQPGTTNTLDTLGDRLMYRAAYRNRAGTDSLVVSQSVDPDGAGTRSAAMRWYEIRNPFSATPTLYQASTFDGGGIGDRWMGSIAMNKDGDMLMGYSIARSTTPTLVPSIAFTGRRLTDPVNTMQTEQVVFTGSGVQTGTLSRWGDYSTMQVDPTDDQTFWYIAEFLPANGTFNWRSRILSAKFNAPTAAPVSISGRVMSQLFNGISKAKVILTNSNGISRTALTNSFGYYTFNEIASGEIYTISVNAKRYRFNPSSQVIQVSDSLADINFISQ